MILGLSDEAVTYGHTADAAFAAAGGDELVSRAEHDPRDRAGSVEPVLAALGAWELDPRGSPDELEASAALCRSAGRVALPYPVAERLARPPGHDAGALVVVAGPRPAAAVGGLALDLVAVGVDGSRWRAEAGEPEADPATSAFVVSLALTPHEQVGEAEQPDLDLALGLVLPCWTLLGMVERALELTREHVQQRRQFDRPLAAFQSVQFQVADAEVERAGIEELAKYATWSIEAGRSDAVEDALALRLAAVSGAATIFRLCHQLHGAIGLCDETPLSTLSRYSQPLRRVPLGLSATRAELTRRLGREGLTGIYGDRGR